MGTIGKIRFEHNIDISFVSNIIASILTGAQGNLSRVVLSFCFRELGLIDKILSETDIEYIEGFTWEESSDIEKILDNDYLKNLLSLNISTDKFQIFTSLLEVNTLPENISMEKQDCVPISIRKILPPDYSLQEENEAKIQLEELCKQVFNDVSTMHFCSSHGESADFVIASLELPFKVISMKLSYLLNLLPYTYYHAAYRVSINRNNKSNFSHDFIRKFEKRPHYIYLPDGGWQRCNIYNMPFAINSQRTLYPICNCNRETAFEFAKFAQSNITKFKNFSLFLPNIVWACDNSISCSNPSNQVMLSLSTKGMELAINYEQYKDSDPPLKKVRDFININLSEFSFSFHNAKPVII